jgi:HlyD family secretion protein
MINFEKPLLLMCLALAGCGNAAARQPERLQGIVEHEERILAFEVGGRVKSLPFERGQDVGVDQVLGELDDGLERPLRDARAAEVTAALAQLHLVEAGPRREEIRATRAELEAVNTQRTLAARTLERQLDLAASGASASSRRDEIDAQIATLQGRARGLEQQLLALRHGARVEEIEAAEARVAAATAALVATDARLARFALESPMNGTVIDRHVAVGEVVAPGTPAFSVADLDRPYVDVFVPEGRMRAIRVGTRARVQVDGLDASLVGEVEHVSNRTEFTPRFLFSDRERPNLVLRVRIRVRDPQHRLHAGVPAFVTVAGLR